MSNLKSIWSFLNGLQFGGGLHGEIFYVPLSKSPTLTTSKTLKQKSKSSKSIKPTKRKIVTSKLEIKPETTDNVVMVDVPNNLKYSNNPMYGQAPLSHLLLGVIKPLWGNFEWQGKPVALIPQTEESKPKSFFKKLFSGPSYNETAWNNPNSSQLGYVDDEVAYNVPGYIQDITAQTFNY